MFVHSHLRAAGVALIVLSTAATAAAARPAPAVEAGASGTAAVPARSAPSAATPAQRRAAQDFDVWAESIGAMRMRADPMSATLMQYFSGKEQERLDGELTPLTLAAQLKLIGKEKAALAELDRFDVQALSPVQRVSAQVIRWALERDVATLPYLHHAYVFDQMGGAQIGLVLYMTQSQPLRHKADVQNYLKRLAGLGTLMGQGVARARESQARGVLMPRFITEKTIDQFEQFLQPAPAANVLVTALAERSAGIDGLSEAERQRALARAQKIVVTQVCPPGAAAWR